MKDLKQKKATPYKARTVEKAVKDVDLEHRTVTGVFNSYFYIDSDMDMLLPGSASKSIKERGVNSTKGNRIKHLKDHEWAQNIARIDVLDERKVIINGMEMDGIYHESYYPESTDSNDQLIKIQEGLYDARSIGFQYDKIVLCQRESENEDNVKNWDKYIKAAINPEVAEEAGYFWTVKEIILWEGSDVSFGANQLTPLLGIKSAGNKEVMQKRLFGKLDTCIKLFKDGNLSDDGFHRLEMEMKQIKSYIASLNDEQSHKRDTIERDSHEPPSTSDSKKFFKTLIDLQ